MKLTIEQHRGGWRAIDQVELTPPSRKLLADALSRCGGQSAWRSRKEAECRDLLKLAQVYPERIKVLELDLSVALRSVIALNVSVPCSAVGGADLCIATGAVLGLEYNEDAMRQPQPGYSFLTVLHPPDVFHPNVHPESRRLCLGVSLSAGIRVRLLLQMAYVALAMQAFQVDELDPAGVMHLAAARWWQGELARVPLTHEPFLPLRLNDSQPACQREG